MSRFCGDRDSRAILEAGSRWRDSALLGSGSVFGASNSWTIANLQDLDKFFSHNLDVGEGSFLSKLRTQLSPCSPEVKQLAAEIVWLLLLCPSNISPSKKRQNIKEIWSWSGAEFPSTHPYLSDDLLTGIGSGGPGFNNHRWRELAFCINILLTFKQLPRTDQTRLASNAWQFAEWLQSIADASARQFRHMLLFLLFPDDFERVFSGGDRREIAEAFSGTPSAEITSMSPLELDRLLRSTRTKLEQKFNTSELDYYWPPLKALWGQNFEQATGSVNAQHVRAAIDEIDRSGVPAHAQSTMYDLIYAAKRYPPKLVLSRAVENATGTPLDRATFSGGEETAAFRLLRDLGFEIVPKKLVAELVEGFLAQANAGTDLSVSSYPKEYRGLQVKVSFGQGAFARVPWIAFLWKEQKVSDGIYPVILYYREAHLLLIAYGVSETTGPSRSWKKPQGTQTIRQFLKEKYSREPERYGDSFVESVFEIPDDFDLGRLTTHLDQVIDLYRTEFSEPAGVAVDEPSLASDESDTYTDEDALVGLFVELQYFELLQERLRSKRNIILQGPPGVGKTFFADRLAHAFVRSRSSDRVEIVQFHPSYSYEDFVQGYRPDGKGGFIRKDGVFYRFCTRAKNDPTHEYVLVIDEINRANLSKVFGEIMMLIEADKREEKWAVELAYSTGEDPRFFVPGNLYVIGLMNTADRSLALVDYALRRRFAFFDIQPGFDTPQFAAVLRNRGVSEELLGRIRKGMALLNEEISNDRDLGAGFRIGHSYFCNPSTQDPPDTWYRKVVESEIAPLLREYWYEDKKADEWTKRLLGG